MLWRDCVFSTESPSPKSILLGEVMLGTFQRLFLVKAQHSTLCLRHFMLPFLYFQGT